MRSGLQNRGKIDIDKSRDPNNNLRIGGNTVYLTASVGMRTVNLDTCEQHIPTIEENDEAVRVLDALEPYRGSWAHSRGVPG
jgi:hypothetical protein